MEVSRNGKKSNGVPSSPKNEANENEEDASQIEMAQCKVESTEAKSSLDDAEIMEPNPNEDTPLIEDTISDKEIRTESSSDLRDITIDGQEPDPVDDQSSGSDEPEDCSDALKEARRRVQTRTFAKYFVSIEDRTDATSKRTLKLYPEDHVNLKDLLDAEQEFVTSHNSRGKSYQLDFRECCEIAKAIYLDDVENLKNLITNGSPLQNVEIQRRLFQAAEQNSLKCLDHLCWMYEEDDECDRYSYWAKPTNLFYRRIYSGSRLSKEHPKETALHVLASKPKAVEAMKVLEKRPKFLRDFKDFPDNHDTSPILVAIKCNNIKVFRRLLTKELAKRSRFYWDIELNRVNIHKESPIRVAAMNDNAEVIKVMLEIYCESEERRQLLDMLLEEGDERSHSILFPATQGGRRDILNLIMKYEFWPEFLEREMRITEDWDVFVGNVCAAGCKKLAKACFKQDPSLLEKREQRFVTPLMRAAEANQERIVRLIYKLKPDYNFLEICDQNSRNVFHYAVKNLDVLLQLAFACIQFGKYDAINSMDDSGNTPLKLAVDGGLKESVMLLVNVTQFEVFSADIVNNVDIEVLERALYVCGRKAPEDTADLLRGDHDKHRPFLEAAYNGNVVLMEFFLRKGANNLQRTPIYQTAIHYAVLSGKLDAVEFLLEKKEFLEMIDFTDEDGITAAGYATSAGHAEILKYLLKKKAKIKSDKAKARKNILDASYDFYETGKDSLKEIVLFCTKDGKIELLEELFEDTSRGSDHIMAKLIQDAPDIAVMILNLCTNEEKRFSCRSYAKVERILQYSFFPFKRKDPKGKLEAIKAMVEDPKGDKFLRHSLVMRFLNKKMYSSSIQNYLLLNFLLYTTFLLTLTTYGAIQSGGVHDLKSPGMIALSIIILIVCGIHFIKEISQMMLNVKDYLHDSENLIELVMYICAVIYVAPGGSTKTSGQIAAGAISVFLAWINFSLFLKTTSGYGLYIIMAIKVFKTVSMVLPLVVLFIIAFSLSFSLLMPQDPGFDNIPISFLTTFVMMTGELDYRDTFLASGPLHVMQKILLLLFILMISIAIMNLFTGLAVGDANEILSQSKEKRRIDKARLVLKLERGLPFFHPLSLIIRSTSGRQLVMKRGRNYLGFLDSNRSFSTMTVTMKMMKTQ
ncbi:transient receptor potential cation channel subfamily A member 1-like [Dendronephthya gigantea]|uniref:transient receptor potential cation channel subfamily A member 1-like n=1 Tax=Dendronephthya gigantea TaxID=151771 RepID=UPI001068EF71|nr:transient receptor potential cation channel subfamily A member 1-like [Dendronephthya gigantea]XP_028392042.1 transient receptor potential cation channel subfamily A member 1-like [Dendronephthya gigantea]XP_028392043.1 transient receptor potential cation channel subfamily A member 1-like [Dendronephthya gigantea]